jgi:hypothetical protein
LFLDGKLPEEFIEFYSNALGLMLLTTKKTKYYAKEHDFDIFFPWQPPLISSSQILKEL